MIILLSPAKTLDLDSPVSDQPTQARFAADAARIARAAAKLSAADLSALMHISAALAKLNVKRFKGFRKAAERPAIRTFAGDVYRGFDAASADADTIAFAQDHLRILSGLYGVVRPLDAIRPYRLEMGTAWAPKDGDKLTDYWGRKVARAVLADLKADGSGVLLNLASQEYYAAVGPHLPKRGVKVIAPDFRVRTAKGLQFQSFTAKVARGAMARWVCEERVADPAALSHFDRDGWRFDSAGSTPDKPLFVRAA
ncbi:MULTISPECIES: YaaA family protein [Sphingomonas]|uniref:YaaA family protein n=1 Tax=Sphingomonas TaxID=13687 RepID=UPI000DEF89EC|nr:MULTISPECIES: YaaA family protein [Sphingomonas]